MSGAGSPTRWTYAEYARLPDDGNRYEVLDGELLVTPSPGTNHQRVVRELFVLLRQYVVDHDLGEVLFGLDLLFVDGQYLCPDMLYVPNEQRDRLTDRGCEGRPGLVVEVVSTSSVRNDRVRKPARYGDFGVPEYWAVDPGRKVVDVWRYDAGAAEPVTVSDRLSWQPEPSVQALEIEVPSLFVVR